MPHKVWAVGEEVLAADFNTYVQDQTVATFPSLSQLQSLWPNAPLGAVAVTTDTFATWMHKAPGGAGWVAANQLHHVRCRRAAVLTAPATANTPFQCKWDTVVEDTEGLYTVASGFYSVPVAGVYDIVSQLSFQGAANSVGISYVYVNGTAASTAFASVPGTQANTARAHHTARLAVGDTIASWGSTSVASGTMRVVATEQFLAVTCLGAG